MIRLKFQFIETLKDAMIVLVVAGCPFIYKDYLTVMITRKNWRDFALKHEDKLRYLHKELVMDEFSREIEPEKPAVEVEL